MNQFIKNELIDLSYFFARTLGPNYQIVLYTVENDTVTGVESVQNMIDESYIEATKRYLNARIKEKNNTSNPFLFHYLGSTHDNRSIRSSSYFIHDESGKLCAVMNVDFDQRRYQALAKEVLHLCHPDSFVDSEPAVTNFSVSTNRNTFNVDPDNTNISRSSLSSVISSILTLEQSQNISSLSVRERNHLISELNKRGIFKVKGAVNELAIILDCSPSTIYRNIKK